MKTMNQTDASRRLRTLSDRWSGCYLLTWVFWILKSTEAVLTASSLGMLCSMAAGTVSRYTRRIYKYITSGWFDSHFSLVRTTSAFPLISVVRVSNWHFVSLKSTRINLQSDIKHNKWDKSRNWVKKKKKVARWVSGIPLQCGDVTRKSQANRYFLFK